MLEGVSPTIIPMVTYLDPGPLDFDAIIERADVSGSSAFVTFPWSVPELFGVRGRVPVSARFDGVDYRGSLVTYGGPRHLLLLLTEIRERLGKQPGDTVHVTVALDTATRRIEPADDTRAALCLLYTSDAADDLLCVDLGG